MKKEYSVYFGKNKIIYSIKYTNRRYVEFKVYVTGSVVAFAPKNTLLIFIKKEAKLQSEKIFRQVILYSLLYPMVNREFMNTIEYYEK